ncbi:uncharacterized protein LOC117291545 [Asterias rubens]|uniref:uncharacterized protein LOC117291545 n=1 Tax=Asterias rubens TaxID=7604 RepID=UPI001454F9E1|nr:uncharacterized protein LOC117291545 [Asterias rubens]
MQTDTAALPAVRIPVDKPVRLVGISHSNNSKSLIDHASSAENIHEAAEIVSQNVAGILADAQYYKTGHLREELVALRQDVQEVSRDRAYEETRDNYHHHFWRADHESENKYLITKLSEIAHALIDFKGDCCNVSRGRQALDEAHLETMCTKHLYEMRNFRREIAPYVNTGMDRSRTIPRLAAPITTGLEWHEYMSPLDNPDRRRPLPNECTITRRETIHPRTDPPTVNGHISGVHIIPSQFAVPDYSGRPGAMNSGTDATLSVMGRYGGRQMYEQSINGRRRPLDQQVQSVSSRYTHKDGFCA